MLKSRKSQKEVEAAFYDLNGIAERIRFESNPEAVYCVKEQIELLRKSLEFTPGLNQRLQILEMHFIQGYSLSFISQRFNIPVEKVSEYLKDSILKIRRKLRIDTK